jgi:predicted DNA-binding transcriptional regulator YafY
MAKKAAKTVKPTKVTPSKPYPTKTRPDRDRRIRQNARIARVLGVLNLIQSRGRWTAKAIGEELECSERTVYRDLEVLEFAGVPYFRDLTDHTIRVRSDFRFPVLSLTDDEVLGQALATTLMQTPGLDITQGTTLTTRKLAASSGEKTKQLFEDAARLVAVLDLKLADHSRHHDVIKTVQLSLVHGKLLTGQYESPYEAAPVKLKLHPYRLCLIKNAWYVIARPVDEGSPRTYRVARFKSIRMLDDQANVPQDFNLRDYFGNAWAVFRGAESYDVEVSFTPDAARVVTETVWHHTQSATTHKDGSITLRFKLDGLEEITNWVMSWTGRIKVLQPKALRDRVVERLKAALKLNEM